MAYNNITPIKLVQSAITTAYVSAYTVPTSTRTFVKDIDITNTTSSTIGIYVHLVPADGTVGTSNALFYNLQLPANTVMQWTGSQIMDHNDTIQFKASAAGCTINITGGEAV